MDDGVQTDVSASVHEKLNLSSLTKIPKKEFEKQFRLWMERDNVARSLQSKLRCDLITNFNNTNLGKRLIAETTNNRLTLSPMVLALNTLVAEFLYAQECQFSLSVFCTEARFRNTLPDFEHSRLFRFNETEIEEIISAICGPAATDWSVNKQVSKNYAGNGSTSLLFCVMKALIEKSAETMQKKVTVGTNTRIKNDSDEDLFGDTTSEGCNVNLSYLNRFLVILSKKVEEMTEQIAELQLHKRAYEDGGSKQPRVRISNSSKLRKYGDFNRSFERLRGNLRQVAHSNQKGKNVDAFVKAIESLALQFQKCATNFENLSNDLKCMSAASAEKPTAESLRPAEKLNTTTSTTGSQTIWKPKKYDDWLHEMRHTRSGQRFMDRVTKIIRKALEKQNKKIEDECDVKFRHQCELLKLRYRQKLIKQLYFSNTEQPNTEDKELKASVSEQFRQFQIKHFDVLSKLYDSEKENIKTSLLVSPNVGVARRIPVEQEDENRSGMEIYSLDLNLPPSNENVHQKKLNRHPLLLVCPPDSRKVVDDLVEQESNVTQLVNDAKSRIKQLELETNHISQHYIVNLEQQRKQKLKARDAAQIVWTEYLQERENMKQRYSFTCVNGIETSKEIENIRSQILDFKPIDCVTRKETEKNERKSHSDSTSSNSSENNHFTNHILKLKEDFYAHEKQFKEEIERISSNASVRRFSAASEFNNVGLSNQMLNNNITLPIDLPLRDSLAIPPSSFNTCLFEHLYNDPLRESVPEICTLWTASPHRMEKVVNTPSDLSHSIQFAQTISGATETKERTNEITKSYSYNREQQPEHRGVSMSQRQGEIFSAILTSPTPKGIRKQTTIPLNTATKIPLTTSMPITEGSHNAKNANVELNNYSVQDGTSLHSVKNSDKNESNYNNKNERSLTDTIEEFHENTIRKRTTARKAFVKESLARIHELFNLHREESRKMHKVREDNEESTVGTNSSETEQQSNEKELIEKKSRKHKDHTVNAVAISSTCENIPSSSKNNSILLQTRTERGEEESSPQQMPNTSSLKEHSGDMGGMGDSNAVTITSSIRKQQCATKTLLNDGDYKSTKGMPAWKPIAYSTMSGTNGQENGKDGTNNAVKVDLVDEDLSEEMNSNPVAEPKSETSENYKSNDDDILGIQDGGTDSNSEFWA